jgi:glycosyltransferase involved in cell wall biosynthesis
MAPLSLDLSVVVPTANRPALLARAVRSCFGSSVWPKEVLIVHDAPSHVDRYAQVYEELSTLPVRRLVHSQQQGPSAARNTGWRAGIASWSYFLDDDDYLLDDGLATIGEALDACHPDTRVLAFGSQVRRADGMHEELPGTVMRKYGTPFWAEVGTLVIRKRCLEEVGGFDPGIGLGENRDLMARLAVRFRVEPVDETIVHLDYGHAGPRQSENQGTIEANIHLLRKNEAIYRSDPLWWRSAHLYAACHAARRGQLGTSLTLYREWTRSAGRRFDARFLGALASSGVSHLREVPPSRSHRPE